MAQAQPQQKPAPQRKDPEFRPVSGVRINEVDLLNKDPRRDYRLIFEGSGSSAEMLSPSMYEQVGYQVERWPDFVGLNGQQLEAAQQSALRFAGGGVGKPGEKMMCRGHVLMSASREHVKAAFAYAQDQLQPIEDAIQPERAAARLRKHAASDRELRGSQMGLDTADAKEMAGARVFAPASDD
jgi:uncharacterized protein YeaC (DUF1315 family)